MFISRVQYEALIRESKTNARMARNALENENAVLNSNSALYDQNQKLKKEIRKWKRMAYAAFNRSKKIKENQIEAFTDLDVIYEAGAYELEKAHADDVGFDIKTPEAFVLQAGETIVIDTKVRMLIPKGYDCKVESKSGLMSKHFVFAVGGEIDAGYTGCIKIILHNLAKEEAYAFNAGDKIAQLVFRRFENPKINIVSEFAEQTDRGNNGFGSSGR